MLDVNEEREPSRRDRLEGRPHRLQRLPVGTVRLNRRHGQLRTTVPGCQVGRTSAIHANRGATTVLSGGSPWKV
jgi:hypothetical protein